MRMITRRLALGAPLAALPFTARAQGGFPAFVASVRAEARRDGIRPAVLDAAFEGVTPNPKIIELDHHQPEFTLTWAQYKTRVLPQTRLDQGRHAYAQEYTRLAAITGTYPADPRIVVGIWGLESGFGAHTGNFRIVEALATLA